MVDWKTVKGFKQEFAVYLDTSVPPTGAGALAVEYLGSVSVASGLTVLNGWPISVGHYTGADCISASPCFVFATDSALDTTSFHDPLTEGDGPQEWSTTGWYTISFTYTNSINNPGTLQVAIAVETPEGVVISHSEWTYQTGIPIETVGGVFDGVFINQLYSAGLKIDNVDIEVIPLNNEIFGAASFCGGVTDCDDNVTCTYDYFNCEEGICVNIPLHALCDDNDTCTFDR